MIKRTDGDSTLYRVLRQGFWIRSTVNCVALGKTVHLAEISLFVIVEYMEW